MRYNELRHQSKFVAARTGELPAEDKARIGMRKKAAAGARDEDYIEIQKKRRLRIRCMRGRAALWRSGRASHIVTHTTLAGSRRVRYGTGSLVGS